MKQGVCPRGRPFVRPCREFVEKEWDSWWGILATWWVICAARRAGAFRLRGASRSPLSDNLKRLRCNRVLSNKNQPSAGRGGGGRGQPNTIFDQHPNDRNQLLINSKNLCRERDGFYHKTTHILVRVYRNSLPTRSRPLITGQRNLQKILVEGLWNPELSIL